MMHIDSGMILVIAAGAMSLFFDYFPGFAAKFDALKTEQKRLITVGLGILVAVVLTGLQVAGIIQSDIQLNLAALANLAYNIVLAVAVQFGFHRATKPNAVGQ